MGPGGPAGADGVGAARSLNSSHSIPSIIRATGNQLGMRPGHWRRAEVPSRGQGEAGERFVGGAQLPAAPPSPHPNEGSNEEQEAV